MPSADCHFLLYKKGEEEERAENVLGKKRAFVI